MKTILSTGEARPRLWATFETETRGHFQDEPARQTFLTWVKEELGFWGPLEARELVSYRLLEEPPERAIWLDCAAGLLRLRQGWTLSQALRATYVELKRPGKDKALKIAKRELLGLESTGMHRRSKAQRMLVGMIAARYQELSGQPVRSRWNDDDKGPGPRLIRAALCWVWWPHEPVGPASIAKWLIGMGRSTTLRDKKVRARRNAYSAGSAGGARCVEP